MTKKFYCRINIIILIWTCLKIKKLRQYAEQGARIYPGHYFKNDFKYESDCLHRNIYFHIKDLEIFLKFVERSSKRNVYLKYEY